MDRKKVIKGLECLAQRKEPTANPCKDCGYINRPNYAICAKDIAADALELLKEQEPADIEMDGGGSTWWYVCGECHGAVDSSDLFCRHCGRPFRKKKNGCDGCTYKGSNDCALRLKDSENVYCPNGKLNG